MVQKSLLSYAKNGTKKRLLDHQVVPHRSTQNAQPHLQAAPNDAKTGLLRLLESNIVKAPAATAPSAIDRYRDCPQQPLLSDQLRAEFASPEPGERAERPHCDKTLMLMRQPEAQENEENGDPEPEPKRKRRTKVKTLGERARRAARALGDRLRPEGGVGGSYVPFNHYEDGAGMWTGDDIGLDGASDSFIWEGAGRTGF